MSKHGWKLLFLMLFFAGCAKVSPMPPQEIVILPPEPLIQGVPGPALPGETNEDLLLWALRLQLWGKECQQDKSSLREWREKAEKLP